jgi:hypothetical protein
MIAAYFLFSLKRIQSIANAALEIGAGNQVREIDAEADDCLR